MSEVYITRTASYLPNEPISNNEMEDYLGLIGERASKSKNIVLRSNGIKSRYYAIDKNGKATHTNAEMASLAIRKLVNNPEEFKEIDLLSCGTSVPDQLMPSHSVMVHGWLPETNNIEVISTAGNCCSGMHAMKYAYMSLKLGESKKAIVSASDRLSRILHADHFEIEHEKLEQLQANTRLAFEKDFLRWMLSDGAAAFMMQTEKNTNDISLRIDWIEACSFANEVDPCMYMGSDFTEDGDLKSFMDYSPQEINDQSILSMKQDVRLLGENIVNLGFKKLDQIIKEKGIDINEIDFFLPHMSSFFFEDKIADMLDQCGQHIPKEKWFTNLESVGNVGAGSPYLIIDDLMKSGKLNVGDQILIAIPESARFSYVFSLLTVC